MWDVCYVHVLDPLIGTVPLLSGPNVIAEPSSSCSEVVAQPMAVNPDSSEFRGLKCGLESVNMETAAVCSFIFGVHVWLNSRRRETFLEIRPLVLCGVARGYAL